MIDLHDQPGADEDRQRTWESSPAYRERLRRMARECREDELDENELRDLHRLEREEN